ncbi:hypothetical protein OsI_31159 [Oryza sativa Indica Group]|uniref:Uncharacterized protein n=2 Tax=Oryza TaxID=4527 RepID=A0A0E0IIN9_ORYNI|nr:hypothetical protein OsI_31159 [Oryza sativa Indica Group]
MATNSATATSKMAVVICMLALILGHQQLMAVDASPAPEQHGLRLLGDCSFCQSDAGACCAAAGCGWTCDGGVAACVCG